MEPCLVNAAGEAGEPENGAWGRLPAGIAAVGSGAQSAVISCLATGLIASGGTLVEAGTVVEVGTFVVGISDAPSAGGTAFGRVAAGSVEADGGVTAGGESAGKRPFTLPAGTQRLPSLRTKSPGARRFSRAIAINWCSSSGPSSQPASLQYHWGVFMSEFVLPGGGDGRYSKDRAVALGLSISRRVARVRFEGICLTIRRNGQRDRGVAAWWMFGPINAGGRRDGRLQPPI